MRSIITCLEPVADYIPIMMMRTAVLAALVTAIGSGSIAVTEAAPSPPPPPVERIVSDYRPAGGPKTDLSAGSGQAGARTEGIAGGFVFVPVNPFRTWDSRDTGLGRLPGGFVNRFTVLTDVNDIQQIPVEAIAVTYNLTVTDTLGAGYLALYPVDIDWPGNSSINWTTNGQTIANGGTVAIGNFEGVIGGIEVYNGPSSPGTHFIIDITGYFI